MSNIILGYADDTEVIVADVELYLSQIIIAIKKRLKHAGFPLTEAVLVNQQMDL